MTELPIAGGVAIFLVLAILLLSLNLASLWKWWIKAGAIVVTLCGIAVLYFVFTGIIGWASTGQMPPRFSLLATRIVEPDRMSGAPGHIYMWAEEIDDRQVVIGPPRAYEVPYEIKIATDVTSAQMKLESGEKVLGEFSPAGSEAANPAEAAPEKGDAEVTMGSAAANASNNSSGGGAETIGDTGAFTFSDMPPVVLPDKGLVIGQ